MTTPSNAELVALAREGKLDDLLELSDGDAAGTGDGLAYKWLCVAADFGHDEADDLIDDLLEGSSLRFDDDQFHTGAAHFELGCAYLVGLDDLPKNLDFGRTHLEEALERGYPASVEEGDKMIAQAAKKLKGEAREVFDEVYAGEGDDD